MKRFVSPAAALALVLSSSSGWAQPTPANDGAAPRGMQMRDVIAKLSPQGQKIFHDSWLTGEKEAIQQRRAATAATEEAVFAAMGAEPFKPGALRHAYEMQRRANAENQRQRHEHLVMVIASLSAPDRQTLVSMLRGLRNQRAVPVRK